MDETQYLTERVDDQIKWYGARSRSNQGWYKRLRVCELVLASLIPLIAGLPFEAEPIKIILGSIGVAVAIISGSLSLLKFQENWIEYRSTGEALKRERFLYLAGADPYIGDNKFARFVARVEAILSSENTRWIEHTTSKAAADGMIRAPAAPVQPEVPGGG